MRFVVKPSLLVGVAGVVVLAGVGFARGQGGQPVNTGHALDRNPQVGSGGYNAPVPAAGQFNSANLYITGNVTGLGAFRGYSPIQDPSQFRAGLGSAGLTFFNRQAVSTADVLGSRTAAGLPYFGRSETIIGTGGILAGRNLPGSSAPLTNYTPPARMYDAAPAAPPAIATREDLLRSGQALSPQAVQPPAPLPASPAPESIISPAMSPYTWAIRSPLFGADASSPDRGVVPGPAAALSGYPGAAANESPGAKNPERRALDGTERPAAPVPAGSRAGMPAPADLGQNLYQDLFRAVRASQAGAADFLAEHASRQIVNRAGEPALRLLRDVHPSLAKESQAGAQKTDLEAGEQRRRIETTSRWVRQLIDAPIRTFAAHGQGTVNRLLLEGERAMRSGRYYDATEYFAQAQRVDPENPLIDLARGHALLAAGEYASAAATIAGAIQRFPQVASLSLDLKVLLGGASVATARQGDLEQLLSAQENAELRFLLGYLEYYSGRTAEGINDLVKAARESPRGSFIAAYPRLLLGESPSSQPSTER